MRHSRRFLPVALAVAGMTVLGGAATIPAGAAQTAGVEIRYSRFEPDRLRFEAGEVVTFVITNHDPIDHEFIVGDQAVQLRHESGTEPHHGSTPTEVSVPAGKTVRTTIAFPEPGELLIGCHLPGHYAYGMKGSISVG